MTSHYSDGLMKLINNEGERKICKKGAYLFREGDPADAVYFVQAGKIRISKVTPDGREITFRVCHQDDFISELRLFCTISSYTVQAKAIEDCICIRIEKGALETELLEDPQLTVDVMKMLGTEYQKNQSKFRDLILHGKKGALYSTLIRMTNTYGVPSQDGILIDLQLTNQELANFCGMSREVVNRLLGELKQEGIVSMSNGNITVHNLQHLKDVIHCENCPLEICRID